MNNKKSTKRALISSVLSLVLCMSMLIGTTFAWFTDTAASKNNKIVAGNLDVQLLMYTGNEEADIDEKGYEDISNTEGSIFGNADSTIAQNNNTDTLWEPGKTQVVYLAIRNNGNLALKYQVNLLVRNPENGKDLYKAMQYVVTGDKEYGESVPWDGTNAKTPTLGTQIVSNGEGQLQKGETHYFALSVHMMEEAGNEYKDGQIDFDLTVLATQLNAERDSFGPDYDKNAALPWDGTAEPAEVNEKGEYEIYNAKQLAWVAEEVNSGNNTFAGKTIRVMQDIDLNNLQWKPIGISSNGWNSKFNGTFIGTGYTISNLYITGEKGLGLFGYVGNAAHIEGVTIDGAYVSGYDYVGAVMGTGYLAANCLKNNVVKNAEIIATPYLMEDGVTYDGGAKAGAVAGYAINGNITGNKAINCSITAYRDLGGIVGMAAGEDRPIEASGNMVENIKLEYVNVPNYADGEVNKNMRSIVGRYDESKVTVSNNSEADVDYIKDGIVYVKDVETGKVILHEVSADYTQDSLVVPVGVDALASGAFKANNTLKKVEIPATVTDFGGNQNAAGTSASGGAFKGNDSIETVVLSEGMTEIPAAAFNYAVNVTSVNIPSTVTKIGVDAFKKCDSIENLVIPTNVTEIGYGAFRDMASLASVTIEGDPVIANFAFRNCAKLENVYLKGENTTFSGSNGQVFTNNETTNSGVVNVYVANKTVEERLWNATSNKKSLNVIVASFVSEPEELTSIATVLEQGGNVVLSTDVAGEAISSSGYGKAGVVIVDGGIFEGNGKTLDVSGADGTWDCAVNPKSGTIKNLTVNGAFRGIFMSGATGDVVIENCVLDDVCYTFNSDAGSKDYSVTIKNTTLNGWTSFSNVHKSVDFINCKFGQGTGAYKYAFCRPYQAVTFKDCAFEAGYTLDISKTTGIVLDNCTIGGVLVTLDNIQDLIGGSEDMHLVPTNVTIK